MTDEKFSDFGNANNASYPTPVGLQAGDNVQMPPNALARAIQDAIAVAVPFNFAGAITASNLSGTNTGDQPPLGFIGVNHALSATMLHYESARQTANSVVLTTPANPVDFEVFRFTNEGGYTGGSIVPNGTPSGQTICGSASLSTAGYTQLAFECQYNATSKDWAMLWLRTA